MGKIIAIDQFEVSDDKSVISHFTNISNVKTNLAQCRLEILEEVDKFLSIGGAEQPIEIIGDFMSVISYYEDAVRKLSNAQPDIAEKYFADFLKGFEGDTMYGVSTLIKFLHKLQIKNEVVRRLEDRKSVV